MAFTTEFVMGAGGAEVEEIPVSMSGGGDGTVYPLTTVDVGPGAIILVAGTMNPATTANARPYLRFGDFTHTEPHIYLTGPTGPGIGVRATGTVAIEILSRYAIGTTTFDGTVYVIRV